MSTELKVLVATSLAQVSIDGTNSYRRGATVTLNPTTKTLTFVDNASVTKLNAVHFSGLGKRAGEPFRSYDEMANWVKQNMMFTGVTLVNVSGRIVDIKGRPQSKSDLQVRWDTEPEVTENSITIVKGNSIVLDKVFYGRIFLDASNTACASYSALIAWAKANLYWKGEYAQLPTVTTQTLSIASTDSGNVAFSDEACDYMQLNNAGAATLQYKRAGSPVFSIAAGTTKRVDGITNANQITIIKPGSGTVVASAEIYHIS